jgi:uncharacterized damage-inducible protein DinB
VRQPARSTFHATRYQRRPVRTSRIYDLLLYAIDNEIQHRGQGFVYLRALGIEPPPLYDRQ